MGKKGCTGQAQAARRVQRALRVNIHGGAGMTALLRGNDEGDPAFEIVRFILTQAALVLLGVACVLGLCLLLGGSLR